MRVPDKIFEMWRSLRTHGDGKLIVERSGITDNDISRTFNTQECSDDVFKAIADFYKEKQEMVKSYMPCEGIVSNATVKE